ncbi:hypothetical protein HPP92_007640 [Vanilla planifolia]|uniref:Uncharacterized protein n=1 Tax=Vanilla planifolia TaxID=51239 RepID=A0A835V632_VANPL|nr:hypothetical protein HPP92_007640 [Vanilla planifolia]
MSGASKTLDKDETVWHHQRDCLKIVALFKLLGKLLHPVTDESCISFESRMDGRAVKALRSDIRELDRITPLQQKIPFHVNNSAEHPIIPVNRLASRNDKDAGDMFSGRRVVKEESDNCNSEAANSTCKENREVQKELKVDKVSGDFNASTTSEIDNNISLDSPMVWTELGMEKRYLSSKHRLNSWHLNSQVNYCYDEVGNVHRMAVAKVSIKGKEVLGVPKIDTCSSTCQENREAGKGLKVHEASVDVKLSSEGKEVQDNMSKIEICSSEVAKTIGQENSEVEQELRADKASISDLNCSTKEEIHNNAPPDSRAILKEPVEDSMTEGYGKEALGNWPKQGTIGMAEVGNIHFPADFKVFSVEQAVSIDKELDLRGEKSLREKDRENNDERYKRWRASDEDKNDIGNSMQLGIVSNSQNKMAENEMKVDMLHRERTESNKYNKGKEQNSPKKELSDIDGMGCVQYENLIDGHQKVEKLEVFCSETTKVNADIFYGNFVLKRKENGINIQDERHGKLDTSVGDRSAQRGNGPFSEGFQQSKKMDCSSCGPSNMKPEPHFSSETCKPAVSPIIYKPGESVPELLKTWKVFEASLSNKNRDVLCGPILEFRIPSQHISFANDELKHAQLWGTDVYTIDSDIVSVLIHAGYYLLPSSPLLATIDELRATVRVLPPQDCYLSSVRNNIHSRAWGSSVHCSYRIERCSIIKKGGDMIKLEPCFTHYSVPEPTISPLPSEWTVMARAGAASNAMWQHRFVQQVPVLYNLCNEPWTKYTVTMVADKGTRKPLYTSTRLKKGDCLYLETHFNRYELCFNGEKTYRNSTSLTCPSPKVKEKHQEHNAHFQAFDKDGTNRESIVDVFRWSRCKKALPQKVMRSIGIPLPVEHLEVLEENLDWEDIQWSQTGVWIAGKEYKLARVHFISPK